MTLNLMTDLQAQAVHSLGDIDRMEWAEGSAIVCHLKSGDVVVVDVMGGQFWLQPGGAA